MKRRIRNLLLVGAIVTSSMFVAAPAQAGPCYGPDLCIPDCQLAEATNKVWRKLTGDDLMYCLY